MATRPDQPPKVLEATAEQAAEIAAIYGSVVTSSHATFDVEPHDEGHWRAVIESSDASAGHHVLVALDPGGHVIGYAKSGLWMSKPAYASTCEVSIHIAENARGAGVGAALYGELIPRLERSPLRLAVAGLALPNEASAALHRRFGFEPVGTFTGVGVKFGRTWDVTWWQRQLCDNQGVTKSPEDAPRSRPL